MSSVARLFVLLGLLGASSVWAQPSVTDVRSNGYNSAGYGSGGVAPSAAQGELFMQLQQLQEEIARLHGMLEEQQYEIQRLKQEGLERYQDLDGRMVRLSQSSAAASAPVAAPTAANTPTPTSSPAATSTPSQPPQPSQAAASADPAKEKLFYEAAFDLIKARDFAKADLAFTAFLRKYPQSQYAGNAQYWLGEVKLAQKDLSGAQLAFTAVGRDYPQHTKAPDALYKLGEVERLQGNTDKARLSFQQVVRNYGNTPAAKLAQRALEQP